MTARAPSLDDFGLLDDGAGPSLDDFALPLGAVSVSMEELAAPLAIVQRDPKPENVSMPTTALALVPRGVAIAETELGYLVPAPEPIPAALAPLAPIEIRPDFTFSLGTLAKAAVDQETGERCTWWLQPGVPWFDGGDNRFTVGGRACHESMRDITRAASVGAPLPTLPAEPDRHALVVQATRWLLDEGILRHKRPGSASLVGSGPVEALLGLRAEVAFAYDTATRKGRELVDPPGWDLRWYADPEKRAAYEGPGGPIRATEIPGRIDLLCTGFDAAGDMFGWIRDYKFHFGPGEPKDAQGQLAFCALAIASTFDLTRVSASAVHIWEDRDVTEEFLLRTTHDGEVSTTLGPNDVGQIAAWVDTLARPAANDLTPHHGPHCTGRDCPAVAACPVMGELAVQVLPAETLVRRRIAGPIETNDDAAFALLAADLFIEVGEQLKARAKTYADEYEGVRLSDGSVFSGKLIPVTKPDLSVPGAIAVMEELGLAESITRSTAWTEAKKHGGAALEKSLRTRLAEIGAVKHSTQMRYEARMPKPERPQ